MIIVFILSANVIKKLTKDSQNGRAQVDKIKYKKERNEIKPAINNLFNLFNHLSTVTRNHIISRHILLLN